jgi:hypothetical protein
MYTVPYKTPQILYYSLLSFMVSATEKEILCISNYRPQNAEQCCDIKVISKLL